MPFEAPGFQPHKAVRRLTTFTTPLHPSRTPDTKVSVDTIVQLFCSLTSGLIAMIADAR